MKKIVFLILIPILFTALSKKAVRSQDRYATCDACGYCLTKQAPADWEKCRQCLYPSAPPNHPESNETLKIDPTINLPPTTYPGHAYTGIGCVKTNLGSFESEGAAKSLIQVLLNFIFSIVGALSFIYLIYGAFFVTTSRGDPEKLNEGKRIILGAAIGLMFSLFAVLIIKIIATQIIKAPGF